MFLIRKAACASYDIERQCVLFRGRDRTCSKKRLCGHVEADSGNRSSTLFLSWRNTAYGSSARGFFNWLGDLEGKSTWCRVGERQCQILAD